MLKDDTRDQIPLFDMPAPDTAAARSVPKGAEQRGADVKKPASAGEAKTSKAPTSAPQRPPAGSRAAKRAPRGGKSAKSSPGPVPEGDVRLTANIREDLHLKLKIVAATRRTTIGELIEDLVEHHL